MSKTPDKFTFQSNNGCTLKDLIPRQQDAQDRWKKASEALAEAKAKLKPIEEECEAAYSTLSNAGCLLNIWWNEYRDACRTAQGKPKPDPFKH